jgi:hypothetical protein
MALNTRKSAVTTHDIKFLKTGAEAKALVAKEQHKTTGKPPPGQVDSAETLSKLPVWQRTSTTLAAQFVYGTGAAILAKSNVRDKALPRRGLEENPQRNRLAEARLRLRVPA